MAEALNAAVRKAGRTRRIPATAKCTACGITDPRTLQCVRRKWICYECAQRQRGFGPTEAHHILGKDLSVVTVDVPANLHRIVSDEQLDIPDEIRLRSNGNPIAWIVRLLCAIRGWCRAIVDMLSRAIGWLCRLLQALEMRFGPQWAAALDLPPIFG